MTFTNIFTNTIANQLGFNGNPNKVFVYIIDVNDCLSNLARFWACLSVEEKKQAESYHSKVLTSRYIVSHGVLRYILSYYTNQFPSNVEFIYGKYKKPFLKNNNIQFNMSHSHSMVCYLIALNYEVGIDIELEDSTLDIQEISNWIFTDAESKFLTTLAPHKKLKFFYSLWTKKEALVKALGQGFFYPINTIEAIALQHGSKICFAAEKNMPEQELYCYTLEVALNYSGTIAINHKINEIVYLKMNNQQNIFDDIVFQYVV